MQRRRVIWKCAVYVCSFQSRRSRRPIMRWRLKGAILLTALTFVALAVYFEPTYCVRGWLRDEAFYEGRPTSYWKDELERWEVHDVGDCLVFRTYKRNASPWQQLFEHYIRKPDDDE